MNKVKKPVFTLLNVDLLESGYKTLAELPDMIETVMDAESLRFVKVGFNLETQPVVHMNGGSSTAARDQLITAMAMRLLDVVPAQYESQADGKRIIMGAEVAQSMAQKLYRRAVMGPLSSISTYLDREWHARVLVKPGVELFFSPDFHHHSLTRNEDMAGGEAMFAGHVVRWRVRSCVGDVSHYLNDSEFVKMWTETVPKHFPFVETNDKAFMVYR
jgi:hypothetical protein